MLTPKEPAPKIVGQIVLAGLEAAISPSFSRDKPLWWLEWGWRVACWLVLV
jgi:hypothetical protein